jgi:hypothetical protein
MPPKSLTLRFGADTTKLERGLKRMRKRIEKSTKGLGRVGGAAFGGALGGITGGAFAGGITGIAGNIFGDMMDISPRLAQAMMNLGERIRMEVVPGLEEFAETLVRAAPAITKALGDLATGVARFIDITRGEKNPAGEPRYASMEGFAGGLKAVGDIRRGDVTGFNGNASEQGAFFRSLFRQMIGNTPPGMLLGLGDQLTPTHYGPTYEPNMSMAANSPVQMITAVTSANEGIGSGTI